MTKETLKKAINEAGLKVLEANEEWMNEKQQAIAQCTLNNFIIELFSILGENA